MTDTISQLLAIGGLSITDRKLVIGIDFGTTYSGVAWAETRRPDFQTVVEIWPANLNTREGMSSPKVPTELRYTPAGLEWGFQIPPAVDRNQWFKLGLYENQRNTGGQKSSEKLAADYLTKLCEHLMYTLDQKLGASILRTVPVKFCITVPAIWSEIAKEKTLRACQNAGLKSGTEIFLVSEPEAAAIYTLQGLDPHTLSVGDTFVVCDAGGGTVDLISYTITDLSPVLRIREAAPGSGGLCGSTFLNRAFGDFLTQKLGHDPNWDDEILEEAMERFESVIKKQFTETIDSGPGYTIPVPGLASNEKLGVRRGRLSIQLAEIKAIFDPIVGQITKLVEDQIKATNVEVKAVFLVGGFGQNNYLKERLRRSLNNTIKVLQPPNAWTAIARGAVLMGIARVEPKLTPINITSRAARKHYGMTLKTQFDATIHNPSMKYWCIKHKTYRVRAVHWLIKKGDPVEENNPVQIKFSKTDCLVGNRPGRVDKIVLCDEISANAPIHENENVQPLVRLKADLSQISSADLASMRTFIGEDGKLRYKIPAIIEATFHSASTTYVLIYNGKRYDTVTAEYV